MIIYKAEALAQLKVKLAEAKVIDDAALAAHRASNIDTAARRRAFIADVRKIRSDQKLAEYPVSWPSARSCPIAWASRVQAEIDMVNLIADDKFQARQNGSLINMLNRTFTTATVC